MATLGTAITVARGLLQDTDSTSYRYSDTDLLQYANDALLIMAEHRPEIFSTIIPFTCVAGALQQFGLGASLGVIDVVSSNTNAAMRECDTDTLDAFRPNWQNDTAGSPRNWARQKGSKYYFYIYPPVAAGTIVTIEHVAVPIYTINQTLDARIDSYEGTLADYIAGKAEAREAETTGPQRSQTFEESFIARIKANK
jgi:hypothetical protein